MTTRKAVLSSVPCLFALACSHAGEVKHMRPVANVDTTPAPNGAVVVFLRPSGWGPGTQSSVFEVTDPGEPVLVGIVAAKMKVAYRTTPGHHVFMSIGENADFMDAMLEPGRIYYVSLIAGPGYKARFILKPAHADQRREVAGWLSDTSWVATTGDSQRWADDNAPSIAKKRARYWPQWIAGELGPREALVGPDGKE
jgi:hypothetical protein